MSDSSAHPTPTEIHLQQKSRILSIAFSDGRRFEYPCEYLRVFSKAAEVRAMGEPVIGKDGVNITRIEPQGQYALRLTVNRQFCEPFTKLHAGDEIAIVPTSPLPPPPPKA